MEKTGLRRSEDVLQDPPQDSRLLICSIYEDQRPLKGAAGALDWRLRGFLSRFVMSGRIQGKRAEFVYVPVQHQSSIRHLLLVGLGRSSEKISSEQIVAKLAATISGLTFKRIAISRSSFPFLTDNQIENHFKEFDVELTQ